MPQNLPSDHGLCCLHTEISMETAVKMNTPTRIPKTGNELILMIRMGKSTDQKRVKSVLYLVLHVVISLVQ